MKKFLTPLFAILFLFSCGTESMIDMQPDLENSAELLAGKIDTDMQTSNMRIASTASCADDCIEPGSEIYYPVSDMATGSSGINTKSVSYSAYNTETDFVVEVTYAITAGPANAKATITIAIDGNEVEYTDVSSGSTVSHTVALTEDWAGCDEVAFSILQEGLGTPITFSESYDLIPVCSEDCSPEFWSQNIQFWTGFDPSDLYADVFGVDRAGTLLENVTVNGGSANGLARHSVAALLNATSTKVDYNLTVAEIIAGVQAAYASGDFESFKNVLEGYNNEICSVEESLEIGDAYQGGIIAYILQDGDPGYVADETHGIIAAPSDQNAGIIQWHNGTIYTIGATGTALGTGMANTNSIVTAQGAGYYAAHLCEDLVLNDFSDWYLPSKDELDKLYQNREVIGGFMDAYYWSSSEANASDAWGQLFFLDGEQLSIYKGITLRVRAVRAF